MVTKTELAKEKWLDKDYKGALRILKTFHIGVDETLHEIFDKGYEAMVHPGFYAQIHGDDWVEGMKQEAIKATNEFFLAWN